MDTTFSVSAIRSALRLNVRWRILPLVGILLLAFALRVGFVADSVYEGDTKHFMLWIEGIRVNGLLKYYDDSFRFGVWDRIYPPLQMLMFKAVAAFYYGQPIYGYLVNDTTFLWSIKIFPLLCELALIAAVYFWLSEHRRLKWIIPGLLAVFPGMIMTTAWWGQYEAPYTLFIVLSLIALNRDRPLLAWGLFAVAVLFKQPAVLLGVILLVLTFRRYGWQMTVKAGLLAALIITVVFAPFVAVNGVDGLSPYLKAGDTFPYLTNNAHNFWYAIATIHKGSHVPFEDRAYKDTVYVLPGISYKNAGFIMFGMFVLLLLVLMWRYYQTRYEFVWAAALYCAFFMLPTQVHERYLYPASVLAIIALAQDKRLWWVVCGLIITFTANILLVLIPYFIPIINQDAIRFALPTALLNVVLFIGIMWIIVRFKKNRTDQYVGLSDTHSTIPQ